MLGGLIDVNNALTKDVKAILFQNYKFAFIAFSF